ncbi:hypothetical protein MKX01_027498 [Papaver californicum]|nr:hypothetical protein MKX01_027498 [Papaver californicum]
MFKFGRVLQELEPNVAGEETSKEEQSAVKMTDHSTELSTQPRNNIGIGEYPNAGQLFEEGKHHQQDVVLDDEKFEDVGGFKILKTQGSLYKKIWFKYGHIASSKILRGDSYSILVTLVSGIMTSLVEMNQCMSSDKMSSEVIESFEFKIKMAEDFEFNVKWLREWFENVKKDFYAEQKLESALVMQDQCLMSAMKQLTETKDEFTKKLTEVKNDFTKKLSGIETTICTLLSETQMKKRKVSRGLFQ